MIVEFWTEMMALEMEAFHHQVDAKQVPDGTVIPSGLLLVLTLPLDDLMPTQPAGRLQALPPVPTTTHAGRQIGTNAPPNYARPPVQPRQTEGVFRNAGAFNAMPKQG